MNKIKLWSILMLMMMLPLSALGQDVIVKKDGSTILSKVLEVNVDNVKYKKHSNINGPTYTILKTDIMSINYENGDKDTFESQSPTQASLSTSQAYPSPPRLITKTAANNNAEIIDAYNLPLKQKGSSLDSKATYVDVFFGITSNSVISNEDIEISFEEHFSHCFNIIIRNKTDKAIYIDKGNCFRVVNMEPYCYYSGTEQTTVGSGSSSGVSLGMGSVASVLGIGGVVGKLAGGAFVGGESSKVSTTTYLSQRVLVIPPHSKSQLCQNKWLWISNSKVKIIDIAEDFATYVKRADGTIKDWNTDAKQFGIYKGDLNLGQLLSYDENNSPYKRHYTLTYSDDEAFRTYSTTKFTLYLKNAVGTKNWSSKGENNIIYPDNKIKISLVELLKKY